MRVLRATASEPHAKLPWSRRSARTLKLPPRPRTRRTVTAEESLVLAGWRPSSYLRRREKEGERERGRERRGRSERRRGEERAREGVERRRRRQRRRPFFSLSIVARRQKKSTIARWAVPLRRPRLGSASTIKASLMEHRRSSLRHLDGKSSSPAIKGRKRNHRCPPDRRRLLRSTLPCRPRWRREKMRKAKKKLGTLLTCASS